MLNASLVRLDVTENLKKIDFGKLNKAWVGKGIQKKLLEYKYRKHLQMTSFFSPHTNLRVNKHNIWRIKYEKLLEML